MTGRSVDEGTGTICPIPDLPTHSRRTEDERARPARISPAVTRRRPQQGARRGTDRRGMNWSVFPRETLTNCFRGDRFRGEADTGEGEEGAVCLRRRSLSSQAPATGPTGAE